MPIDKNEVKPSLGIMPKWLWETQRKEALHDAIKRRKEVKEFVPYDWYDEYFDLLERYPDVDRKA